MLWLGPLNADLIGPRGERTSSDKDERKNAFRVVKEKWGSALAGAGQDLEAYYAALNGIACDYHRVRNGQDMGEPRLQGKVEWEQQYPATDPVTGDAVAASQEARVLRAKRLANLVQSWSPGLDREVQRKQILDSLIDDEPADSVWRAHFAGLRTRQQVVDLLGRARAELATEQVWVRSRRRQRWYDWCNDQLANGSAKLFKCCLLYTSDAADE